MSEIFRLGSHFIIELSGCDPDRLFDNEYVRSAFLQSARDSNLSIVEHGGFAFEPHGFTFYLLLAESHASIHVWPEYAYCAVDLFTCNLEMGAEDFTRALGEAFGAEYVTVQLIERGCRPETLPNTRQPWSSEQLKGSSQASPNGDSA